MPISYPLDLNLLFGILAKKHDRAMIYDGHVIIVNL